MNDKSKSVFNSMMGNNPFKLGLFGLNADGGLTMTTVPERWNLDWDEMKDVALMADNANLEFILPMARWKGYGGLLNSRGKSFETLAQSAGLAAITKKILLFSTVHVPLVHPVFTAKSLATIDHISHGRAGLNIVSGWNQPEFDMFGVEQPENRQEYAGEWHEILNKIFSSKEVFDFSGKYFQLKDVISEPKLYNRKQPLTMSAAFAPAGRDFAVKNSDVLFTTFPDFEGAKIQIADIKNRMEKEKRSIDIFTTTHVVCRETQKEAEEYYEYYAVENADNGGIENYVKLNKKYGAAHDERVFAGEMKRFAGGLGTYPLIGTPEKIASEIIEMYKVGFSGMSISMVNPKKELAFFLEKVLPLLVKAELRY